MGLLTAIATNKIFYSVEEVARLLADSSADLGDEESCVDVFVAHGIRPYQFGGSLLDARIEAHNIRTLRQVQGKALPFTKLPEIKP